MVPCVNMATWKDSVLHWKRKLEKGVPEEKILEILHKLERVPITVELLQETGIGKAVNGLKKYEGEIARKAVQVVALWKKTVCATGSEAKPAVKPVTKYPTASNGLYSSSTANKYLSKNSHASPQFNSQKYTAEEEDYDPSSSKHDYIDFKQKSGDSGYDPNATQQDYRKFLESYESPSPSFNGNSNSTTPNKYLDNSSNKYLSQDSDVEKEEYDNYYDRHASEYIKNEFNNELEDAGDLSDNQYSHNSTNKNSSSSKSYKPSPSTSSSTPTKDKVKEKHRSSSSAEKSHSQEKKHKTSDSKVNHKSLSKHKGESKSESRSESKSVERTKSSKKSSDKKSSKDPVVIEGFNSTNASFEACLGFNDCVTPVVKSKPKATPTKPIPSNSVSKHSSSHKHKHRETKSAEPKSAEPKSVGPKSAEQKSAEPHVSKKAEHKKRKDESSKSSHKSSHKRKSEKQKDAVPEALKKPKLKPLEQVDILSTLPEIQPEYKPLRLRIPDSPPPKKKSMSNEEAIAYTSSRKDKTAVYAGRRQHVNIEVPSLFDCCVKVLIENIDGLGYTGGVPFDVLKPILEKCTPVQLYSFEDYNHYLMEDTDELWEIHLRRDFKARQPDAGETWRDLYLRLYDEREARLKSVTANISASMAKATPVRQTKLAYVDCVAKAPRSVARSQARFGTGLPVAHPMKAGPRAVATARPTAPAVNSANVERVERFTPSSSRESSSSQMKKIVKVAPLMQKTIKFMKQRFRR